MSDWGVPLGMNVKDNPLIRSNFIASNDEEDESAPTGPRHLLTESGIFILTEGAFYLDTE